MIELSDGTLITGDWKYIVMYKPYKTNPKDESLTYIESNTILINSDVTSLLQIDYSVFVSAHSLLGMVNFYDLGTNQSFTVRGVKCSTDSPHCLGLITTQANSNGGQSAENNKIVLVGGNQMITLISVKLKMIISKLMIPEANAIRIIINSGYNFNTNNIICSGLFRQYSFDLVNYSIIKNSNNQFQLMETCRYAEVDKNLINSILILKKSNAKSASDVEMFTGGNDKIIKIYS